MPNIYDIALDILDKNPQIANSPLGSNFKQALKNRDEAQGSELANNILNSKGLNKESAFRDIQNRFPNFPFF